MRAIGGFVPMAALLVALWLMVAPGVRAQDNAAAIDTAIHAILEGDDEPTAAALKALRELGDKGAVAPLIQMLFWTDAPGPVVDVLTALTGAAPGDTYFAWMAWQQEHENAPYAGYSALLTELYTGLDRGYGRFLRPDIPHVVRLEEIAWGGVKPAGIPPLDNPKFVAAGEAAYLNPDDAVFGVEINGDARAYPLRIMNWHEVANDVVGGVPVSLAYCVLCGAGILYDGRVEGAPAAVTFATSGLLYRSNKLMYDRISESLWEQFTGRPVIGQLAHVPVKLRQLPMVQTSWAAWRAGHPGTRVLSVETGYSRNYAPDGAYRAYFAAPGPAFPVAWRNRSMAPKALVFGMEAAGGAKAWPVEMFATTPLVQDRVGLQEVVLIGEAGAVRAYDATAHRFSRAGGDRLAAADGTWRITEEALVGPEGRSLPRLAGHLAYWFAWAALYPE